MSSGGRKSTYRWGISSFLVSDVIASTVGSPPHCRPTTGARPPAAKADDLPVMLGTLTVASSAKGDGGLSVRSGHTASTQSGSWPVRKPAVQRLT